MYSKRLFKQIDNSCLDNQEKEIYKTIVFYWEDIKRVIQELKEKDKNLTIGKIRQTLYNNFGVAPAILFSFSHLFLEKTPQEYIEKVLKTREATEKAFNK